MGRRTEVLGLVAAPSLLLTAASFGAVSKALAAGRLAGWKKVSSDSDAASECAFS
jgi:hypothetical protein